MITARHLTIGYRNHVVVSDITVSLLPGRLTAFIGRNGAGKSTLIRTLTGEIPPLSGEVLLEDRPLTQWCGRELAHRIAIVTTDPIMAGALTVREVAALGRDPHTGIFGRLHADDKAAVQQALQNTGMTALADRLFASLSDGEKQKCLIARALAQDTPIIILDEPFSYLDVAARVELLGLLLDLCHEKGKFILFSTHDVAQALRMADEIWMLTAQGQLQTGSPEELVANGNINLLFDSQNVKFDMTEHDFISTTPFYK